MHRVCISSQTIHCWTQKTRPMPALRKNARMAERVVRADKGDPRGSLYRIYVGILMNTSRVKVIMRSMSQGRAISRARNMHTTLGMKVSVIS